MFSKRPKNDHFYLRAKNGTYPQLKIWENPPNKNIESVGTNYIRKDEKRGQKPKDKSGWKRDWLKENLYD